MIVCITYRRSCRSLDVDAEAVEAVLAELPRVDARVLRAKLALPVLEARAVLPGVFGMVRPDLLHAPPELEKNAF